MPLGDKTCAIKLDGIWFEFGMAVYDKSLIRDAPMAYVMKDGWPVGSERTYVEVRDAHLGYQPLLGRLHDFYGKAGWRRDARVYATSKVRMAPDALKKLGLKNTPAA